MELKCTNPECGREWTYTGKKTYPAYATCPDCHRNIKLLKGVNDEVDDEVNDRLCDAAWM